MIALIDIRQYISDLGIAEDANVYLGKLDNKKQKAIGVYSRKQEGTPYIALGGLDSTTYATKSISLLIHWNRSFLESETAANKIYQKLLQESQISTLIMGNTQIEFIRLMVPEPVDIGTDESGVYEYVIWVDVIYQRKEIEKDGNRKSLSGI